jgi:hypothetical protein
MITIYSNFLIKIFVLILAFVFHVNVYDSLWQLSNMRLACSLLLRDY